MKTPLHDSFHMMKGDFPATMDASLDELNLLEWLVGQWTDCTPYLPHFLLKHFRANVTKNLQFLHLTNHSTRREAYCEGAGTFCARHIICLVTEKYTIWRRMKR